jgi:hypothetical protein
VPLTRYCTTSAAAVEPVRVNVNVPVSGPVSDALASLAATVTVAGREGVHRHRIGARGSRRVGHRQRDHVGAHDVGREARATDDAPASVAALPAGTDVNAH